MTKKMEKYKVSRHRDNKALIVSGEYQLSSDGKWLISLIPGIPGSVTWEYAQENATITKIEQQ